ncbi:hypothetical protein BOO69_09735 [Sulfitobacter alexandrii]|uniref:Uncharacterized protein n=1 Tax=Sulfitobacter alexandrii TaxID=1917485 RepID=A0A1J0WHL5_9RHOB|nr:hypothetical protein [Sulfitobacter alexandrii]APE43664.1 hypothetical protein BOO69_09735 [Sulfitobacter alexandrii]
MTVKRILQQTVKNALVSAPAGAPTLNTAAERGLLDLLYQPAWRAKNKSWFSARAARLGGDGFVQDVVGWLPGLDGEPQYLLRHPEDTTNANRMRRGTGSDGMVTLGQDDPVAAANAMGTLLSSANAVLPSVAVDQSAQMTVAFLMQQPPASGGFILSADDLGSGTNQMAVGFSGGTEAVSAYSRRNPAALAQTVDDVIPDALMLLVVEFTGLAAAGIYINGVKQTLSGTPNCGAVLGGQRFRIGSIRTDAGASFSTPADGYVEEIWVFPGVDTEAENAIHAALRAYCLEKHSGMTIAS